MSTADKYVALFEDRHNWPSCVTDYVYAKRDGGYDTRDFDLFKNLASNKFKTWKEEGVVTVHLYLSGLVTATIAALNAAHEANITVIVYSYSNLINEWLPQTLAFLPSNISEKDKENLQVEKDIKNVLTKAEKRVIINYVNLYNKLREHFNPEKNTWEDVYKFVHREYSNVDNEFLALMKPCLLRLEDDYPGKLRAAVRRRKDKSSYKRLHKLSNSKPAGW